MHAFKMWRLVHITKSQGWHLLLVTVSIWPLVPWERIQSFSMCICEELYLKKWDVLRRYGQIKLLLVFPPKNTELRTFWNHPHAMLIQSNNVLCFTRKILKILVTMQNIENNRATVEEMFSICPDWKKNLHILKDCCNLKKCFSI